MTAPRHLACPYCGENVRLLGTLRDKVAVPDCLRCDGCYAEWDFEGSPTRMPPEIEEENTS